MTAPEFMFGLPDADHLHDNPVDVYEMDIEWRAEEESRDRAGATPYIIEEWTMAPPINHVRPARDIIEDIVERIYDDGEYDDDGTGSLDGLEKEPDLLALAEALREGIARRMTWRMADRKVAEHTLTFDAEGKPLLNGEPLHGRKAEQVQVTVADEDDPAPDVGQVVELPEEAVILDPPRLCRECGARHRSDDDNTLCPRFDPEEAP